MGPKQFPLLPTEVNLWRKTSHFNFKLTERPKYVPGSGPPLPPISLLPPHDKEGIILDLVNVSGSPRYLVGYKDGHSQQNSRGLGIPTNKSKRAAEEDLPIIEAKEARRLRKPEKHAAKKLGKSRVKVERTRRPRKREHIINVLRRPSVSGMGLLAPDPSPPAKRFRLAEDIPVTSSRRRSGHEGQPSLSMPVSGTVEFIAIDKGSEEDDMGIPTRVALARQLQETLSSYTPGGNMLVSMSVSTSSEPREGSSAMLSISTPRSDDAFYETSLSRPKSLTGLSRANDGEFYIKETAKANQTYSQDDENEDDVYDVKGILDDEWRRAPDGTMERYFFIDWGGDWEPTWEPEANVGIRAIEEFEEMLKGKATEPSWISI
ncbi:hypothetical protein F5884DRAFT_869484 [Xylogone sp. PMI_703]|nr:hypothetical protein F5884DRAFT_869484 [Xylogone sp. PMI_703]